MVRFHQELRLTPKRVAGQDLGTVPAAQDPYRAALQKKVADAPQTAGVWE